MAEPTPYIVEAVAVSANSGGTMGVKSALAQAIELAMSTAAVDAYANNITDVDQIKNLMQLAREQAKVGYYARGSAE